MFLDAFTATLSIYSLVTLVTIIWLARQKTDHHS